MDQGWFFNVARGASLLQRQKALLPLDQAVEEGRKVSCRDGAVDKANLRMQATAVTRAGSANRPPPRLIRTLAGRAADPMLIRGSELVTNVFGYWPSFHDAEVVRLGLERAEPYDAGPNLVADIHTFEMTSDVSATGEYVLNNHVLVSFRFMGIDQFRLEGFNNQNVLMGLTITDICTHQLEHLKYEVQFDGSFGLEAHFLCCDAVVENVLPWES